MPPAGWQDWALGVLGVKTVTLGVQRGLRHCRQRLECAYGRRSPSDAFERVRRVEVLGLATDGWLSIPINSQ